VNTMYAKQPFRKRDEASAPQLRRHPPAEMALDVHGSSASLDASQQVLADDAANDSLEPGVRSAFERALRTPLASARTSAMALLEQLEGSHAERMTAVLADLAEVEGALGDLYEFLMSSAAGGLRVSRRRVDLRLLCGRVLDALQAANPEYVIAFSCESPVEGQWDPERIASLLSRLVRSAIQQGVPWRTIGVSLSDLTDFVALEVTSDGPPLGDDATGGPFRPFAVGRPLGDVGADGRGSLGLDLYLAREVVRAHGGSIEARSHDGRVTVIARLPRSCHWVFR
jgi:signal transduction histidine kinase